MKQWHATILTISLLLGTSVCTQGVEADFTLREHLGHGWTNACVTFPLTEAQLAAAEQGKALVDGRGQEIAYQIVVSDGLSSIALQADLAPYQTLAYGFAARPAAKPQTDLHVDTLKDTVSLGNGQIGIEIRQSLQPGQGPIARLRLGPSTWTAGSTLVGGGPVADYAAEVVAAGPVFAEVLCRATFADQGTWTLRFRIERGEPVVRVEEHFDAPSGGVFQVALGDSAFQPSHLMYRNSDVTSAAVMAEPIADFLLEPWLRWSNPRRGNWMALYTPTPVSLKKAGTTLEAGAPDPLIEALKEEVADTLQDPHPEMLVVGVLRPSLWRDPQWQGAAAQVAPQVQAKLHDGVMTLEMPVRGGRRLWLLGSLDKTRSANILMEKNRRVAPPPQHLVIKHGDFPLNAVKDFVLDWSGDADNHPLLYIRKRDLPTLKSRLASDPAELRRWTSQQPIDKYYLDGPIREFIASGDARLGAMMAARGSEYLQTCVDWYLKQDERLTPGAAPHMQTLIISALNLLDPVLSTACVTPELRQRLLAQIAFLGYVVNSPDYWSAERGYSSFANMSSTVALFQTALGCMAPSHPRGREWAERGLHELRRQLLAWSDEDGGWLEAPHYAMVSYDFIIGGFMMGANAGFDEYAYDARLRKVAEWFAGIATPRDSRTGGFRHQPPIGNTYHGEPTGVYGLLAGLWQERDPGFAARMQWMYQENGSFGGLGIGWNFPTMLGYRFLLTAHGVAPQPADFGSAWFRQTGVALRNTMRSDRETYLHLIAGANHDHYDYDSGSIILYGKGRVLADDWGYIGRHADKWHSMLTSPAAGGGGKMQVEAFAAAPALDYVSGRKGAWQRQIAFAKDADPLGPTFFLLRDTHADASPATWRLWLMAEPRPESRKAATPALPAVSLDPHAGKDGEIRLPDDMLADDARKPTTPKARAAPGVALHDRGATLIGGEDVDLDIFLYEPKKLALALETATQNVTCGYRDGQERPLANTQTALTATLQGHGAVVALLYPRLKTEPAPKVTWSADGTVVQVVTAAGADTVFLASAAAEASASHDGQVRFQGTAGAVQERSGHLTLTLGGPGAIHAGKQALIASEPTTKRVRK